MSEHSGKVIDGTARASQWRRSSPSAETDADGAQGHSEAPKNIASSLLVPAEMLIVDAPSAESDGIQDGRIEDDLSQDLERAASHASFVAEDHHVNPFLAPDSATTQIDTSHRGLRAVVHSVADRLRGGRRHGQDDRRKWAIANRRPFTPRPITKAVWVLGAVAALAAGTAIVGQLTSPGPDQRQSQDAGSASALESIKEGLMAASANPFGARTSERQSIDRVRRDHASPRGLRSHRAAATSKRPPRTTKHHAVTAHYTRTATPVSYRANPDTQSTPAPSPPAQASPPPASTHSTSPATSGSSSRSSSTSRAPSKATLRSLVTGAGQCSCQ
jgi:hypothetical protein